MNRKKRSMKAKRVLEKLLIITIGIAVTVIWIIHDPGFTWMFHDIHMVFISIIPIPGFIFGYFFQAIPAIIAILIAWLEIK